MEIDERAFKELCETLVGETREIIERIGNWLLQLEGNLAPQARNDALSNCLRETHNIKGAAASLGFHTTSLICHSLESAVSTFRTGALEPASLDAVHEGLSQLLCSLELGAAAIEDPKIRECLEALSAFVSEPLEEVPPSSRSPASMSSEIPASIPGGEVTTFFSYSSPDSRDSPFVPIGADLEEALSVGTPSRIHVDLDLGGSPAASEEATLRVSLKKLSSLMAQVGELLAARLRSDQRLAELKGILADQESRLERLNAARRAMRDLDGTRLDAWGRRLLVGHTQSVRDQKSVVRELRELVRALESDAFQSSILSGELQEDIRRIQTFPLASVLNPLPRAVRNMARAVDRKVRLVIEGAEIELDKKVLEELRDPLTHCLRNAVDHGIEAPEARISKGKPETGVIFISAEHRGESVIIRIKDDGPGVDLDAVRQKAVQRGLLRADQAHDVADTQLLELLFSTGFSTRDSASALSGRGFGLDVVRANIESLRGTVGIESRRGVGTQITITLPLTVYVVHSLLVQVGTELMALPISSVERIVRAPVSSIVEIEDSEAMLLEGRPTALLRLSTLLGMPPSVTERDWLSVIVIGSGHQRCALAVDEIIGDETLLAKNLDPPLVRLRNIAGASVRGDGRVLLMLNPVDLLRAAQLASGTSAQGLSRDASRVLSALLVEDSDTTRALERSVLQAAGFEVTAVTNGEEALQALLDGRHFDVVISDVKMPRMSGLELCRAIREDNRLKELPVILVTSLHSDDDRREGLAAGADSYIAKREFDHEQLLSVVWNLMGRTA